MGKTLHINIENSETGILRIIPIIDTEASEVSITVDGQTTKVYTGKNFKPKAAIQLPPPEPSIPCQCPRCNK